MTASQMVNLSTSQMVMNGLNDESTSQRFERLKRLERFERTRVRLLLLVPAQPGYFMNCCRETAEMGVPPGNRAQRRRLRRVQGVGSEAYLNGTSQGPTPEDTSKDVQICGRSR